MSQRLSSEFMEILSGNLPVHPTTGMRAIGIVGGKPVWPVFGGSAGQGEGGTAGDDDKEGGTAGGSAGDGGTGDAGDGNSDGEGTKPDVVTRDEYEALKRRMQAADTNRAQVEKELQQFKDKDKTELQKAQDEAKQARDSLTAAQETIRQQAVKLSVFTHANHITWHDPADALDFIMKDDEVRALSVNDDGTVDGKAVKAAADRVAKAKQYLVKNDKNDKKDDGAGTTRTGGGMGGGRGDDSRIDRAKLADKYPALRR